VLTRLEEAAEVELYSRGELPHEELIARIAGKQGLLSVVTDAIDRAVLEAGRDLKIVSTIAVGYNSPLVRRVATWAVGSAYQGTMRMVSGSGRPYDSRVRRSMRARAQRRPSASWSSAYAGSVTVRRSACRRPCRRRLPSSSKLE